MAKRSDRRVQAAGVGILDVARTREAVEAYFGVYRRFRFLLEEGTVPREALSPVPGYEDAADPEAIHAPGFSFSGGGAREMDGKLRYMSWFIGDVKRTVWRLPNCQRDITMVQFMGREQLKNEEAYKQLVGMGWPVSERHYRSEKSLALGILAEAWNLEVYQLP